MYLFYVPKYSGNMDFNCKRAGCTPHGSRQLVSMSLTQDHVKHLILVISVFCVHVESC